MATVYVSDKSFTEQGSFGQFVGAVATQLGLGDLVKRHTLGQVWKQAYQVALAELDTYSPNELAADLRISTSDIRGVAAEEADRRVDLFVAKNPQYRQAARGRASFGFAGR